MPKKINVRLMSKDQRTKLAEKQWIILTVAEYAIYTSLSLSAARARVFYSEKHGTELPGVKFVDKRFGNTFLWVESIDSIPHIPELKYKARTEAKYRRVLIRNRKIEVPNTRPKRYYMDVYLDGKLFGTVNRYTKLVTCESEFARHNPTVYFKEIKAVFQLKPE